MELELASDVRGVAKQGRRERREENWCNRWVGKHFGMGTAKERRRMGGEKNGKESASHRKRNGKRREDGDGGDICQSGVKEDSRLENKVRSDSNSGQG